jgi:intein/homing endonuclease
VGSRLETDSAYIAGFLDGDGSLMLQVKSRADTKRGVRFMATICLYQDTRHEKPLHWVRERLGIGYISRRNDGMTELRINGFEQVRDILITLKPFIRFKAKQTQAMIDACTLLSQKFIRELSKRERQRLIELTFLIRKENYKSRSVLTKEKLNRQLSLTP